jgi:hypothetical protein
VSKQVNLFQTVRQRAVVPRQPASAVAYLCRVIAAQIQGPMHEPPLTVRSGKPWHPAPAARHPMGHDDDVLTGKPPTLYPVGAGELARLEIGPGIVWVLGGAPGAGKTALSM